MLFQAQSKNKKILVIIFGLILLIGIFCFVQFKTFDQPEGIACTLEAKICPDGTAVGRSGPNCEFAECPVQKSETKSGFGNDQVEKAITNYLLTQKFFSWNNRTDSISFCSIENLAPERELFPLYVWVYCGEYIAENGELKAVSGSSGPAKINYPNELSFYDLSKFSYEAPGDGEAYAESIQKIFPEELWQKVFNFEAKNIIKKTEDIALKNILMWEEIKQAVANCEVKQVFQAHDRTVKADLKNGKELSAVEPKIDAIIAVANEAKAKCGEVLVGTE